MGSQNEQKPVIRPPMQLPASHPVGRRGTPSRPIKGSNSQSRQAPEPGRSSASRTARPAEGRFQPPNSQFHRRSFGQAVAEAFTGMQSALQGVQRARPRRDDYGAPSEALARANSRPARFDDEDARDYTSYTDASIEAPASRWDEDSAEYHAQHDPWNRQWTDWSERDGDADDDRYDDDVYAESSEWESRRHDRTAWGGWPDAGTMASVAVNAVASGSSSKKRSKNSTAAAKPTTSSFKQLLTWAGSGFSQRAMPTRKAINLLLVLCILGTLVLSTVGMAFAGYNDYSSILTGAKAGQAALTQMGENLGLGKSAKTIDTVAAYNDLTQALNDFQLMHDRLAHPDFILGVAGDVPIVNQKLQSGLALTTIGVEAMQMMQRIFPAIVSISKVIATSPISTAGDTNTIDPAQLLRAPDILNLTQGFNDAKPYIDSMIATLKNTPPDVLVSALNSKQKGEILPFLQFVPQLPNVISFVNDFLPLAPTLLGTSGEVGYALTTLDNGEIRPVGGFQGQVALFSVNGGHVSHISLQDIYQIENKSYGTSNVPVGVNEPWWNNNGLGYNIRNSGLSPDFPTSARDYLNELHRQPLCKTPLVYPNPSTDVYGCRGANRYTYPYDPKAYYSEGNHIPIADPKSGAITGYEPQSVPMVGMIVIQQQVIKQLIQRTGSIQVGCPYNVTVTPDNLEQKIHFYQETDEGNQVNKVACAGGSASATKRFSSIVATTLLNKIKTISKTDLIGFVGDVLQDFKTRDIQVYFADPNKASYSPYTTGENFLAKYGATSTVYTGPGDSLMVNQANIAGDKLDNYLSLKLVDNITIGRDHSATHNLTINYVYNLPTITVNPAHAKYQLPWGQLQAWQVDVYNTIFNAAYSPDYAEFRRIYVAPHAVYLTGTGLLNCTGCKDVYNPSTFPIYPNVSDVPGRIAYGAFYDYRVQSLDNTTVNWFAPDQIPNPTMSWKVPEITQNGTYSLMLQRQSGMTTNADITIQCSNGKTLSHVAQAITVDTPLSVPTAGC